MTITIVNAHHLKGKQPIKYRTISRPSPLGNPYRISETCTREQAIALYKPWLWQHIKRGSGSVYEELIELRDRYLAGDDLVLSCWCKPLLCHGDVVVAAVCWLAEQMQGRQTIQPTDRTHDQSIDQVHDQPMDQNRNQSSLSLGDTVIWHGAFAHLSFLEPFEIQVIDGDRVYLKWISVPVKLCDLEKIDV